MPSMIGLYRTIKSRRPETQKTVQALEEPKLRRQELQRLRRRETRPKEAAFLKAEGNREQGTSQGTRPLPTGIK